MSGVLLHVAGDFGHLVHLVLGDLAGRDLEEYVARQGCGHFLDNDFLYDLLYGHLYDALDNVGLVVGLFWVGHSL